MMQGIPASAQERFTATYSPRWPSYSRVSAATASRQSGESARALGAFVFAASASNGNLFSRSSRSRGATPSSERARAGERPLPLSSAGRSSPYPICSAVRITSLRVPILAAAPQGCLIDVGIYSDVEINGNHYPKNRLFAATIPGNVAGNIDIPVTLDLAPAVYHIVWATNVNYGCSNSPGIHGTAAWNLYIDSINDNGRNEVVASYGGGGLWPVFPNGKGYGKGAYYLQLYYAQYLP